MLFQDVFIYPKVKDEVISLEDDEDEENPEDRKWDCPICLKQLPPLKTLEQHLRTHFTSTESQDEPQCLICEQKFNRLSKLISHIVSSHRNEEERADEEQEQSEEQSPEESDEDRSSNNNDTDYDQEAEEYNERFGKKARISRRKRFECPICHKKVACLYTHRQTHDPSLKKYEKCPICDKVVSYLKQHKKIHGPAEFECEICGKQFVMHTNLQVHMKTHNKKWEGERKKCEKCGRTVRNWTQHQRQHAGEENGFTCEICPKLYDTKAELRHHVRHAHTENKDNAEDKHQCTLCGRLFRRKQLLLHMIHHSEERKFPCPLCDWKFKTKYQLQRHTRNIHDRTEGAGRVRSFKVIRRKIK